MVLIMKILEEIYLLLFCMYIVFVLVGSLLNLGDDWKLILLIENCGVGILVIEILSLFVCEFV